MATLKYSRQRESIKEFLTGRTDHPTADFVYENMKQPWNCIPKPLSSR